MREEHIAKYPVHQVGARLHTEHWIPAEELEELNRNIVGAATASPMAAARPATSCRYYINTVAASATTPKLYAAAMFDHAAVSSDGGTNWTTSSTIGVGGQPGQQIGYAPLFIVLPAVPPAGTQPGDVYLAASSAELLADGSVVPPTATDPRVIGHLFITHDRGVSWTPLSGSGAGALPDVPIWAVKYDLHDAATIYVATEIGVYQSADSGASWARFGTGLPMVRTTDLAIARDASFVRISTWGRGVWELALVDDGNGDGAPGTTAGGGCGCDTSHGAPVTAISGCGLVLIAILRRRRSRPLSG